MRDTEEDVLRLFVSSPGDVEDERRRVDLVVERINAEFEGRVRIETVRWETAYYSAHASFQPQIPEAADCDLVVAIFRGRLGTPLPEEFGRTADGDAYPSGTAYEVISAIEARKAGKGLPDVYVFRHPRAPAPALDAPDRAEVEAQWLALKAFFARWFRTEGGEFLAAFQDYASTDDFAVRLEDCLRQWLARRGHVATGPVWDRLTKGSPFPGLAAFDADRRGVYFGRDLAIEQGLERLRPTVSEPGRAPFLLVIGASGTGKSSLLRAGLLPRLVEPGTVPEIDLWRQAVVTPGPDPFLSLAEALLAPQALGPELRDGPFATATLLSRQLGGDPETASAVIGAALERAAETRRAAAAFEEARPARLALAIDQAERLFEEAPAEQAGRFSALIDALARGGLAVVVLALRSDAYPRFQADPALVRLRDDGAWLDLVAPTAAELEAMVTRPVDACIPPLAFERADGLSLATRLVADAKGGDALPLLQTTLARLHAAEAARGDGVLRHGDYRGIDAAVTEAADGALAGLDASAPGARAALPALVAGLVSDVDAEPGTGRLLPVVGPLDRRAFEAGRPERAALVSALVEARLLTAEGDEAGERVRPAHEAFLRIWPAAQAILAETGALIRVRRALEPIVRGWAPAGEAEKAGHLDISPAMLAGAQKLVERFGDDLPAAMRAFIAEASAAAEKRAAREKAEQERRLRDAEALAVARRRTSRIAVAGLAGALALAGVAVWQWNEAGLHATRAEEEAALAQAARERAERTLELATGTANGLVFDLAVRFRNTAGVPVATIRDILDRARALQDQLAEGGEASPALRRSRAATLAEMTETLLAIGDSDGALAAARESLAIIAALAESDPGNAQRQRDLSVTQEKVGDVRVAKGDLAGALDAYEVALAIRETLAARDPGNAQWQRDLSVNHIMLGNVRLAQGNLAGALDAYEAGLAIRETLAARDPGNTDWQRDLSVSHSKVGDVRRAQGDLTGALDAYAAALVIAETLADRDPSNAVWQSDLSVSHERIGDVRVAKGDLAGTLDAYAAALAIAETLAERDSGNAEWQRELSVRHNKVGDVRRAQGDLTGALGAYAASLAISETLAARDPSNAGWQRDLSVSHDRVGVVRVAQGDLAGALDAYAASLAINETLAARDPGNAGWQRDLIVSRFKLGEVGIEPRSNYQAALDIALAMQARGILAPSDAFIPDLLRARLAALGEAAE